MSQPLSPIVRPALLAAGLVLLLAACGAPASSPDFSPIPPVGSSAPSQAPASPPAGQAGAPGLLLEVTSEGGFINPLVSLSAVPEVVVDDDGRIYTPDRTAASTSIVQPVAVRDVGPAGAAQIRDAIRAAGLDHESSGGGIAPDTGATVFTAVVDGNTVVSRFTRGGAPGVGGPGVPGGVTGGTGGSGSSGDPGAAAFALLARLTDATETWGASAAQPTAYTPVGYRVFDAPASPADATGATEAWPLATALAGFGAPAVADLGTPGLRSGLVTGADAATLAPLLAAATPDTVFTSGGLAYRLWVQPLFPDALGG